MHKTHPAQPFVGLLRGVTAAVWLTAALASTAPPAHAQPSPVFGPEDFVRQRGAPVTVTRSFTVGQPAGLYRLRIDNGGAAGQFGRVSSAVVTLNGTVVVGTNAFNQTVQLIEREVPLLGQNELRVELLSSPGSGLTLSILQVPLEIRITTPEAGFVTPENAVDVSGTIQGNAASLLVNGLPAQVTGTTFTAQDVPLAEGTNRIVAIATNAAGEAATDSVLIRRDTDPPLVVIETPRDGERLLSETVTIAGTVNDIIPGATVNSDDVTVTVNGQPAAVNNRTFTFPDLPLALGENTVTAVAVDRAGNTRSTRVMVTREPDLAGIRITILSGNNQQGPIGSSLPQPLVVAVRTEGGEALAGRPVEFEVSKGDGLLGEPAPNLRRILLLTDAAGTASVPFTLGSRTGEGFHRVRVTTPGSLTFAEFCATAQPTAPTTMSVTLRPPVRSAAGERMADPLAVIVTDAGGNPVPGVPVTFQVELGGGSFDGQESVIATTNPDGIAQAFWTLGPDAGVENNRASANFEGNHGFPATFIVSGLRADPAGETTVSGIVQNSNGGPITGARVEIRGTGLATLTGPDGRFTISGVPPGEQRVAILGSTANDPDDGIFFPHIDFALQVVQGAENALDQIVVLPFLDMAGSKIVGGDEDVILGMEGVPGFAIKVFAHSTIREDGSRGPVRMSSSQVKFDKVPMPPPRGSTAFIVGTLQPGGVRFDPPAQVIYPNVEGLAPGDVADIYAFHHDIGQFVNVGPGTVSEDASVVVSDPGFGIVESGWHCLIRLPGPTANCANNCSSQLEWQLVKADGSLGPVKTSGPVLLSSTDTNAGKAKIKVQFTPGGGSFDSSNWSGGPPAVTLSDQSAAGTTARVTAEAAAAGQSTLTSPTYRIPVPGQSDKTCSAEIDVLVLEIELKEVTFAGAAFSEVKQDNGMPYAPPHWQDNSSPLDGDADDSGDQKFPVSFVRNTKPRLTAKFMLTNAASFPGPWKVRGDGPGGIDIPETAATLSGDELTISNVETSGPFANTIQFLNPLEIRWEVSSDGGSTWAPAGSSKNRVYVTLNAPAANTLFETILEIGCRNADGKSTSSDATAAIWSDFSGPVPGVKRKAIDGFNRTDGQEMRYWNPVTGTCQSLSIMLMSPTGNGSCVAWSQLFHETLDAVGVTGSQIFEIQADTSVNSGADGFLVKNWRYGRHIRSGPNGICNSDTAGDDHTLVVKNNGFPNTDCVGPGPNGVLNTARSGDDQISGATINTGANGICNTTRAGDDVQILPVGQGQPDLPCITPGADGTLNSARAGDDTDRDGLFAGSTYTHALFTGSFGPDPFGVAFGDVANQPGIPGQANSEPPPLFFNHFVVKIGSSIYDPSYGAGPFSSENGHENAAIDGLRAMTTSGLTVAKRNAAAQELVYTHRPSTE